MSDTNKIVPHSARDKDGELVKEIVEYLRHSNLQIAAANVLRLARKYGVL